ncbi:MAG TPA: tail fiber protein [Urbifossiella sp.]|jgi:microcystin-dependent protein|nr:tail fiber protein [Urbifossiella sp.]
MAQPFLGEIRLMAFNLAPRGWAFCNGQTLSIQQNAALFSILGTTYGGNGTTTFALPNLQGRTPVYVGQGIVLGQVAGQVAHTLITPEIPIHVHTMTGVVAPAANQKTIEGNMPGAPTFNFYSKSGSPAGFDPTAVTPNTGNQPHSNMQPYLVVTFCIALAGIFPSRN